RSAIPSGRLTIPPTGCLERELPAVVVRRRQFYARDAELAFLRQHRQHGGHRSLGQPELTGNIARAHRAEPLQARANVAVDLAPPAVHVAPFSDVPDCSP